MGVVARLFSKYMNKELTDYLKGKTIAEASRKLGVSRQTIYNWLKGTHGLTLKNWNKIVTRLKQ